MQMFVCLVLIIIHLDSQSKFQKFALFSGRHIGILEVSYLVIFYKITIS